MTRMEWGTPGERLFEAGVDRGVLYVDGAGVPWNGLISVVEESTGGEPKPFYQDGIKYSNRASIEEFGATITAYTYPDEFALCDGSAAIGWGLFAMQQRRRSFSMSYRTMIGNDIDGLKHGYKIHLIYNALAAPMKSSGGVIGETIEASSFSWTVTTRPPVAGRHRPTSHFVIDTRIASDTMIKNIESIIYGSEESPPRIPSVQELVYLFEVDATGFYDAGVVGSTDYLVLDGGVIPAVQTSTLDGGFA